MKRTICLIGVALGALAPAPALAVDGQVAITQAKAMAGGVTPGDAPGFPVSINLPGSYVLSSGLTVPDANTTAIEINADHVTIDLNGFAILGPTDCSGKPLECANTGNGSGIITPGIHFNITIRNGTIEGMGHRGVYLQGGAHLVEYLHVRSNGNNGLGVDPSEGQSGSVIQHNTVQRNGGFGITVYSGIVADNTINLNRGFGIYLAEGTVLHNVVAGNDQGALFLEPSVIYIGNVMNWNGKGFLGFGHNGGQNLCDSAICPGAEF